MLLILRTVALLLLAATAGEKKTIEKRGSDGKLLYKREVRDDGHGNQIKDGLEVNYFSDETKSTEYRYHDDVRDGPWVEWYSGGKDKKRAEGTYHQGVKTGVETQYLPNGDRFEQTSYKEGKRQGKRIEWGPGEQKTLEADYDQDQLHGQFRQWYSTDRPRTSATYVHGSKEGWERSWYPPAAQDKENKLRLEVEYHNGQISGVLREYYPDGVTIKTLAHYRDGAKQGRMTQWFETGLKKSDANYIADQIHGAYSEWYDDPKHPLLPPRSDETGAQFKLGNYVHGKAEGVQTVWHPENKQKQVELIAHDGMNQGPWTEWYKNGHIKAKGRFKDNQLDGPVRTYYEEEDGKEHTIDCYSKGLLNGRRAELDKDGKTLVRDQIYKQGVLVEDKLHPIEKKSGEKGSSKGAEKGTATGTEKK